MWKQANTAPEAAEHVSTMWSGVRENPHTKNKSAMEGCKMNLLGIENGKWPHCPPRPAAASTHRAHFTAYYVSFDSFKLAPKKKTNISWSHFKRQREKKAPLWLTDNFQHQHASMGIRDTHLSSPHMIYLSLLQWIDVFRFCISGLHNWAFSFPLSSLSCLAPNRAVDDGSSDTAWSKNPLAL